MFEPYDILILAHTKDSNVLPLTLKSIRENIKGYNNIHVITNDPSKLPIKTSDKIFVHYEQDVLPADLSLFKFRPTWVYQQLIKLLQTVTTKNYLIIDSDMVFLKPLPIFTEQGTPNFFISSRDEFSPFYYNFNKKYFNIDKKYPHTFISEIMFFHRPFIKELFTSINLLTTDQILDFFYKTVTQHERLSEFELYGNFIETKYPNIYSKYNFNCDSRASEVLNFWSPEKIQNIITELQLKNDIPSVVVFHNWAVKN